MNESEKLVEPSPKIGDALLAGVNAPALTFQVFLAQYVLYLLLCERFVQKIVVRQEFHSRHIVTACLFGNAAIFHHIMVEVGLQVCVPFYIRHTLQPVIRINEPLLSACSIFIFVFLAERLYIVSKYSTSLNLLWQFA